MKLKIALLLAVLAAFLSFGTPAFAGGGTVSIQMHAPVYIGGDGNGYFGTYWTTHDSLAGETYRIETITFIWVSPNGFRNLLPGGVDNGSYINHNTDYTWSANINANGVLGGINYGCGYPGFHNFYTLVFFKWQTYSPTTGWRAWVDVGPLYSASPVYGATCF